MRGWGGGGRGVVLGRGGQVSGSNVGWGLRIVGCDRCNVRWGWCIG